MLVSQLEKPINDSLSRCKARLAVAYSASGAVIVNEIPMSISYSQVRHFTGLKDGPTSGTTSPLAYKVISATKQYFYVPTNQS